MKTTLKKFRDKFDNNNVELEFAELWAKFFKHSTINLLWRSENVQNKVFEIMDIEIEVEEYESMGKYCYLFHYSNGLYFTIFSDDKIEL